MPHESDAKFSLKRAELRQQLASQQLQQFKMLKHKMYSLYRMQGFKNMVKNNPNMSQFFGIIQKDLQGEEGNAKITAQVTGRSVNMMEFSRMIEKIRYNHKLQQQRKESFKENPQVKIDILYDQTSKDVGVLIKLNNLHKRMQVVKHLIGDWKPTPKKYATITDQVSYCHKKLELLNEQKIVFFQKRAEIVKKEVVDLFEQTMVGSDPTGTLDKIKQRQNEMGHDKKTID